MQGMSPIVKNITRLVAGFITVFAVYDVVYGHVEPGGGFSGGVMLAASVVLVVLAFGGDFARRVLSVEVARWTTSLAVLAFLVVALGGYMVGQFFENFLWRGQVGELASAGTLAITSLAVGIEVGAGLFAAFVALAVFRRGGQASAGPGEMLET